MSSFASWQYWETLIYLQHPSSLPSERLSLNNRAPNRFCVLILVLTTHGYEMFLSQLSLCQLPPRGTSKTIVQSETLQMLRVDWKTNEGFIEVESVKGEEREERGVASLEEALLAVAVRCRWREVVVASEDMGEREETCL